MQPTDNVRERLKSLTLIYCKAKEMILLAEELDPSSRSNVMVIKELRDSNDHLMRLFEEWIVNDNPEKDEKYMLAQIDKARGHVFRAGYDAIDGIVVGYKVKAARAMEKISNGAIAAVNPEYYTRAAEADILSEKIAAHRNNKDVADDSLANLEAYAKDAAVVAKFCKETLVLVPRMIKWDKNNWWAVVIQNLIWLFGLGVILAVLGGWAYAYFEHRMESHAEQTPRAPQITNNVSVGTNK